MSWEFVQAEMTWQYVAGFTDGEGCIRVQHDQRGVPQFDVKLYQNSENAFVLWEIQEFLSQFDIDGHFYESKRKKDARHPTEGYFLTIRKIGHVYRLLTYIQPYVIVKAPIVATVIRMIEKKKADKTTDHPAYRGW